MANVKKCDRCGAFYEKNVENKIKREDGALEVSPSILQLITVSHYIVRQYDLCDDCFSKLITWIGDKESELDAV